MTTYEIVTIIISIISLMITSILTVYIFHRNVSLSKKQTELQKQIFKYQEKQDNLMLHISEKPHWESIFKLIYSVYDFILYITFICNMKENDKVLAKIFKDALEKNKEIYNNFDFKFDVAISYTNGYLSDLISEVKGCLIDLERDINKFILLADGTLTQNEESDFQGLRDTILEACEHIGSTQKDVIKEFKSKFKFSSFDDIN